MKKILMTLVAAMATVSMSAQYYVGGTLGFGSTKTPGATTEVKTSNFSIAPEVGMALDEKLGVGIAINFNSSTNKTEFIGTAAGTPSVETTVTTIGLQPYARYQFLKLGKANIFIDGGINFAMQSQKDMKAGMELGLFATPGIAFDINDQWSLVAKVNRIFDLTYRKQPVPDVAGAPDAPTSFDLNAGLRNDLFTSGGLTFGIYYKF